MAAKKGNTRALDYNKVEKEPKVGTTWHNNLWL